MEDTIQLTPFPYHITLLYRDFPVDCSPSGGTRMVSQEHPEMPHLIFLHLQMGKLNTSHVVIGMVQGVGMGIM